MNDCAAHRSASQSGAVGCAKTPLARGNTRTTETRMYLIKRRSPFRRDFYAPALPRLLRSLAAAARELRHAVTARDVRPRHAVARPDILAAGLQGPRTALQQRHVRGRARGRIEPASARAVDQLQPARTGPDG